MSKVEVDQVTQQSGTTLTVGGGACKTAVVDATTVTLGRCGGTVSLASGATQSGFGRTGTVDWITTPKVTGDSPVTGVTGKGYFLNTTAGTITLNLPAGAAGSIVSMADYAATWDSNKVTVSPNGTDKIGSINNDVDLTTEGQSVTFVYVDSTQGWLNTMDSTSNVRATDSPVATGGNAIVTCGNYKIHVFTSPGTFCVSAISATPACNSADYIIVGGAGGGASNHGGAGGAGGYRESPGSSTCYTASPLGAAPAAAQTLAVQGYPIVVGGGGTASCSCCNIPAPSRSGNNSSFNSIVGAAGGGGGGVGPHPAYKPGADGGSGGSGGSNGCNAGGTGNTPPVTPSQGNNGGASINNPSNHAGGGGGALVVGTAGTGLQGGPGGAGANTQIISPTNPLAPSYGTPGPATARYFSGGGGGGSRNAGAAGVGGAGGGGKGSCGGPGSSPCGAVAGTINTGGGGGSCGQPGATGGNGGSGVVMIRYKFQ